MLDQCFQVPADNEQANVVFAEPIYVTSQQNVIAELKASKDISITGIKKFKVERQQVELQQEKTSNQQFEKQFSSENFLEKVSARLWSMWKVLTAPGSRNFLQNTDI